MTAALSGDPQTLDQAATGSQLTYLVSQNIFEGLFAIDANFAPQPMLVDTYTVSEDGMTYDFSLRSGVTFQDGSPLVAADVVASLNRWMQVSATGTAVRPNVTDVVAVGDQEVQIRLNAPRYSLIGDLAFNSGAAIIIPAQIADAAGVTPLTPEQIIGTGPYKLDEYQPGQSVVLTRYEDYVSRSDPSSGLAGAKHAYADELVFEFVPDASQRLNGLKTQQWDWVQSISADDVQGVLSDPNISTSIGPSGRVQTILLNNKSESVFSDPRARQAINLLVDPNTFAVGTFGPKELWDPLSPSFVNSSNKPLFTEAGAETFAAYDPDEAKQLFASAGVGAGSTIKILVTQTYPEMYQWGVILQSELEKIGIKGELTVLDFASLVAKANSDPSSWDISASFFLTSITSPSQLQWLSPGYRVGYDSKTMQDLLADYQSSTDDADAKASVNAVQTQIYKDLPVIQVGAVSDLGVYSPRLQFSDNWSQVLWNAWVTDN